MKSFILISLFCLAIVSYVSAVVTTPGVVLTTRLGRIRGTIEMIDDGSGSSATSNRVLFDAFRGIPYAKAPVGHLRWQEPIAYGMWLSDLDATTFRSPCPQFERATGNVIGSEDCLFLNVYTPHSTSSQGNDAIPRQSDDLGERSFSNYLPVMVWFHGGAYNRGGSHQFGPQFLMREDVVLVTVNYRLGLLGFLSTGDANLPGNYAMLDAVEALKWVRDNIVSFGGDPERVTIFGESAGGAITHLLSLSPLTAGLFHRAIYQSASALCDWSVEKNPLEFARIIAKHLQCPLDPAGLASCMRGKDVQQLVRSQVAQQRYSLMPVRCGPVVDAGSRDKPFLPDMPRNLILNKAYKPIPMVSGVTLNEGLLFYLWIYTENMAKMSNPAFLEHELIPGIVSSVMNNQSHLEDIVKLVKQQYIGGIDYADIESIMPRISQIIDDSMFTSCVYEAQILHAKTSPAPVYAYVYSYKGEETPSYAAVFSDLVKRSGFRHPLINTGVTHADELLYLFRMAGFSATYSQSDIKMSQWMTRLWTQFARTGDPMQQAAISGETAIWPRISPTGDSVTYFKLDLGRTETVGVDYRKAEHYFWLHVIPHIRNAISEHQQINETSLTATWALLGLFIAAIIVIALLVLTLFRKERKRRYPERGVVLQRAN